MRPDRGAAPVAHVVDLPEDEAWMVAALRLWSLDDGAGTAALADAIAERIGRGRGDRFVSLFGDLMALVVDHTRRPMMRHKPDCPCVGADEAVFANFVAIATHGPREDAMLIATLFLRADVVPIAVSLAQTLGLELTRGLSVAVPKRNVTLH